MKFTFVQVGPEKGVTHLAVAALINALWDLWAKLEGKPVWRLLTDMDPKVSFLNQFYQPEWKQKIMIL